MITNLFLSNLDCLFITKILELISVIYYSKTKYMNIRCWKTRVLKKINECGLVLNDKFCKD